jgi:hypothetical protein
MNSKIQSSLIETALYLSIIAATLTSLKISKNATKHQEAINNIDYGEVCEDICILQDDYISEQKLIKRRVSLLR